MLRSVLWRPARRERPHSVRPRAGHAVACLLGDGAAQPRRVIGHVARRAGARARRRRQGAPARHALAGRSRGGLHRLAAGAAHSLNDRGMSPSQVLAGEVLTDVRAGTTRGGEARDAVRCQLTGGGGRGAAVCGHQPARSDHVRRQCHQGACCGVVLSACGLSLTLRLCSASPASTPPRCASHFIHWSSLLCSCPRPQLPLVIIGCMHSLSAC